jgi:predicted PurR-regulated permease PerM
VAALRTPHDDTTRRVQLVPGLAAVVITVLLLWLAGSVASVLMMFFISMLIAVFLDAVTDKLEEKLRLKRSLAFGLALILSGLALFALGALIVPSSTRRDSSSRVSPSTSKGGENRSMTSRCAFRRLRRSSAPTSSRS